MGLLDDELVLSDSGPFLRKYIEKAIIDFDNRLFF